MVRMRRQVRGVFAPAVGICGRATITGATGGYRCIDSAGYHRGVGAVGDAVRRVISESVRFGEVDHGGLRSLQKYEELA